MEQQKPRLQEQFANSFQDVTDALEQPTEPTLTVGGQEPDQKLFRPSQRQAPQKTQPAEPALSGR